MARCITSLGPKMNTPIAWTCANILPQEYNHRLGLPLEVLHQLCRLALHSASLRLLGAAPLNQALEHLHLGNQAHLLSRQRLVKLVALDSLLRLGQTLRSVSRQQLR